MEKRTVSIVERLKRRWQEFSGEEDLPVDGDSPAWLVSLVLHVAVLLALALVGIVELPRSEPLVTITAPMEREKPIVIPQEVFVTSELQPELGSQSKESESVALEAVAPTFNELPKVDVTMVEDISADVSFEPLDFDAAAPVVAAQAMAKGRGTEASTGASGAVDRLTLEIKNTLEQGPTVVCWLFDQSVSLAGQREAIAGRLDRVFAELGLIGSEKAKKELLNIVIAYGKSVHKVTEKPTAEVGDVVGAIRSIPIDDSGAEMTFEAIQRAAEATRVFRTTKPMRNVMIIAFTDEVGNDQEKVDQTCKICRDFAMPVYVVGVPAPFGMREVRFKFVDPDPAYAQEPQWAQIEQGPESYFPEVVRVRSGRYADEAIDSGFGPYALSRLCAESGGIYFAVHANRGSTGRVDDRSVAAMSSQLRHFFDPQVMRPYAPEYLSLPKLKQKVAANKAVVSLLEASTQAEVQPMESPEMTFPKKNEGDLVNLLSEAQKVAAVLEPKINNLYSILAKGEGDRAKIREKRWQAGYDLAMGRVLATKIRTEAYNQMLAKAKTGMVFKTAGNDTWVLEPSDEISVGSQVEKLAKQAKTYLERVVQEHPGTPWAMIAADELRMPLGYRWTEIHTGVNDPPPGAGDGVAMAPNDDKKRMLAPPPKKRDLTKL